MKDFLFQIFIFINIRALSLIKALTSILYFRLYDDINIKFLQNFVLVDLFSGNYSLKFQYLNNF